MNKISQNEIEFSKFSVLDDFGRVFYWHGRVFRAIRNEKVAQARNLFSSGLIQRLVTEGLFVDSKITDYEIDGYGMVIEHELAHVVTYPFEWSFSMLKAAGEMVLHLNKIAAEYGYQTKDIHPYNVLFFGVNPKFIDLGSFIRVTNGFTKQLYTFDEFAKCYLFPLKIWARGDSFTARRYIQRWKLMAPVDAYISYRLGGNVGVLRRLVFRLWKARYRLQRIPHVLDSSSPGAFEKYHAFISAFWRVAAAFSLSRFANLARNVHRCYLPSLKSQWGNYHGQLYLSNGKPVLSERLQKIVEIVSALKPRTVTDMAGNQGVLSEVMAELDGVERVTCIDYDDEAVEKGYVRVAHSQSLSGKLHFAVVNPFYPEVNKFERAPESRFKSELVLSLALTHHLILTQGYSLEYIFETIAGFSSKYVLIEFMPLGLFDSVSQTGGGHPDWYTEEWFRAEYERHFEVIDVMKLEINRTLFVGRLHGNMEGESA